MNEKDKLYLWENIFGYKVEKDNFIRICNYGLIDIF